jgi:hypothetical protein
MKSLLFLLVTVFAVPPAHATHVVGLGSKTVEKCAYALDPAIALIRKLKYPEDWTVYVTCSDSQWQTLRQESGATTNYAFTDLAQKSSFMRGQMFRDSMPDVTQWRYTPETVFAHELGHIRCYLNNPTNRKCRSEAAAEKWAGQPAKTVRTVDPWMPSPIERNRPIQPPHHGRYPD